ncbi:MAG: extracellular solute-binding protein [Treponema sp.]|nr:extracellular solute-binding protein [Treponema sp.]
MKKSVKAAALLASAAMVVGLAGCGGAGTAATGKTGRPLVTFMLTDFEGSPLTGEHSDEVKNKVAEYTNTDVEFQWVANDSYSEKIGLALANPSDMPMVMSIGNFNAAIIDAAESGAFWDLNEFIWDEEKYPNLSKANKNVCQSLTLNGKLIGLYKSRDIGRNGMGYRTDWAEKLGLGVPKTVEDVYNMLYQFTYGDPDGNGVKDTYGLAMCKHTGPFDIMQTWFGCGNGWVEQNNRMVPVHQTKEYQDALDWLRKIYEDGLMAPDWAVRDTSTWADQVKKGESGVFVDVMDGSRRIWDYFVNNKVPSVADPSKLASMTLLGPVNGKTQATTGYNGFLVITKAAKTKAQVEACLHFIDKMDDNEMLLLTTYGLEGVNYHVDNEGYLVQDTIGDPSALKAYGPLNQSQVFISGKTTDPAPKDNPRVQKQKEVVKLNEQYAVFNPALAYLVNSPTYSTQGAILDQLLSDARTQYICGRIDKKGLEAEYTKWNKQGGEHLVAEVNEQYQKNKR